jgi:antitoxin ChpS
MLAVPPTILELLRLKAGSAVELTVDGERLVIERQAKPRFTLAELLAQSDYSAPLTAEEQEWLGAPPAGRELL